MESALIYRVGAVFLLEIFLDKENEVRCLDAGVLRIVEFHLLVHRLVVLFLCDEVVRKHLGEHEIFARIKCVFVVAVWREVRRLLWEGGYVGSLC